MKHIITVSAVTFNAKWGKKDLNLSRILGYTEAAAKRGTDFIVFPEMALTGYDDEIDKPKPEKMQTLEAELIPGPSSEAVAAITKKYGIYAVFGMPERDSLDPSIIYNSVAICGPDGSIRSYRKMHLPYPEPHWATRGDHPCVIETEWGPIGISICYDSYHFPEMIRYEGARGARMHINCTALAQCHGRSQGTTTLECHVIENQMYIVSANLGGKDLYNDFWGGSSIMGPSRNTWEVHYYAGYPFTHPKALESDMVTATIDLTLATRDIFRANPLIDGKADFRPDKYIEMFKEILEDPHYGEE